MASRSLIGAGAVVTAALVGIGVGAYATSGGDSERGTVELVDVSTTPSPETTAEPTAEPTPTPSETTTTTATVEPEPVVTSVAPPPAPEPAPKEEPVSEPVVEPKPESTYTEAPAANSREAGNPNGPPMGTSATPPPAPDEPAPAPVPDVKVWGPPPAP